MKGDGADKQEYEIPHHLQPSFLSPPPHLLPPRQYPPQHLQYSENSQITPIKPTSPPSKKPRYTPTPTATVTTSTTTEDGGSIEVSRRPRGRPPGSRNKPKPRVIITREAKPELELEPAMSPYILELPSGSDLVDSLTRFTRRRGVGICVLTATGAVENVTLKQPSTSVPGGTVTFHGRFDILSLSACVMTTDTTPFDVSIGGFTVSLAGPHGQIVGGKVVGSLVCVGPVYVVATSFGSPSYIRLPLEIEDNWSNQHLSDRVTGGDGGQSCSPVLSEGDGEGDGSSGTHMRMYSSHNMGCSNSSEALLAPTPLAARPPQPTHSTL